MSGEEMTQHQAPTRWRRVHAALLLFGAITVASLIWAGFRSTGAEKAIQKNLNDMRTAGEPVSSQDLARIFPDPPQRLDTLYVFAAPFMITTNVTAVGPVPIMSNALYDRKLPLEVPVHDALTNYCARSAGITNLMPDSCPPDTRFAPHWQLGFTNSFVGFRAIRLLMESLAAHTLNAIEAGDRAAAGNLLEHDFRLSGAVQSESLLVGHMIHHACDNLACSVAERALNHIQFQDEQLARIASVMTAEAPSDLTNAMRASRCHTIWELEQIQAGRSMAYFFPSGNSPTEPFWKRQLKRWKEGPEFRDEDFGLYLEFVNRSRAILSLPAGPAMDQMEALRGELSKKTRSQVGHELFAWNQSSVIRSHATSVANFEAARTAIAIERFRLAHQDALPDTLQELVPKFISAVARDPFDHQSLRYKKIARGYVVYSIGPDGIDDGGLERLNQRATNNYDVTFTVERDAFAGQ